MDIAKLKGLLHAIVNIAGNGAIWTLVPEEYKVFVMLAFNLVQVLLSFVDPTYTIQKLGMSKQEYLGKAR